MATILLMDDSASTRNGSMLAGLGHRLSALGFKCVWESGRDETKRLIASRDLLANRLYSQVLAHDCDALVMDIEWKGSGYDGFGIVETAITDLGLAMHRQMITFVTIHRIVAESRKTAASLGYHPEQVCHKDASAFDHIVQRYRGLFTKDELDSPNSGQ